LADRTMSFVVAIGLLVTAESLHTKMLDRSFACLIITIPANSTAAPFSSTPTEATVRGMHFEVTFRRPFKEIVDTVAG